MVKVNRLPAQVPISYVASLSRWVNVIDSTNKTIDPYSEASIPAFTSLGGTDE